ncbi:MAG: ABC transporter substrate-binding protein [Comamonas sp.]
MSESVSIFPAAGRRRFLQVAVQAAGAAAVLGLPAVRARAQAGPDLSRVTLRVGDQTGAVRGQLQAAGLLDAVPYKIDWSVYPAAVNLHEALKADATDLGAANDSPTVSAIAGGSRVKVVSAWSNGGRGTSLIVPKGSPLRSLADLRGKTISPTTRGSVAHFQVVELLKLAGIPLSEVKLAFLSPTDASAAFGSGGLDAWSIWGIFRARAIGSLGARVLDDGTRVNSGLLLNSATHSALADPGKRAAIAHFSDLQERSYAWARANRQGWIDWYAGFAKQAPAVVADLYDENVSYRRIGVDDALVARLRKTYAVWLDTGVLSGAIDFDQYVVRDLAVG